MSFTSKFWIKGLYSTFWKFIQDFFCEKLLKSFHEKLLKIKNILLKKFQVKKLCYTFIKTFLWKVFIHSPTLFSNFSLAINISYSIYHLPFLYVYLSIASDFHSSITIDILPSSAAAYSISLFHIFNWIIGEYVQKLWWVDERKEEEKAKKS